MCSYKFEFTFASVLTSQSFASILAVSEESGGQEDSRFDKPLCFLSNFIVHLKLLDCVGLFHLNELLQFSKFLE